MIKLKQLTFSNIGRFVGDHSIDFESKSNFIQVDAKNLNTGGSSGSGKSTIFQALEYLFGCNDTPTTILQSRLTKEKIAATAVLEKDGQEILISRGKHGLSITIGQEVIDGNVKLAEEKLQQLLGVKSDFLRKMFHKRQNEGGFFLNMKPSESYQFLSDMLGIDTWTKKLEIAELAVHQIQAEKAQTESNIKTAESSYENVKNSLESLTEPVKDFDEDKIGELQAKLDPILTKIADLEAKYKIDKDKIEEIHKLALKALIKPQQTEEPSDSSIIDLERQIDNLHRERLKTNQDRLNQIKSIDDKILAIKTTIAHHEREKERLPVLKESLNDLKQSILKTKENKCPTCAQDWHGGNKDLAFDTYIAQAKKVSEQIKAIELLPTKEELAEQARPLLEQKKALEAVQVDFSDLESLKAELNQKKQVLEAKRKEHRAAYAKANEEFHATVTDINVQLSQSLKDLEAEFLSKFNYLKSLNDNLSQEIRDLKSKKATYDALIKSYTHSKDNLTKLVYSEKAKAILLKEKLAELDGKGFIAQESAKLLKSFIAQLFQDCLGNIAQRATQVLNRTPNMATASIQFESFKETKSGTIKAEINAVLSVDNEIGVPIRSLSGGERNVVDLAVDLAVIDVLEQMVGAGVDFIVFDEPFANLDSTSKEECLTILGQHFSGKKIIIVDHSSETKELVNDKIVVVRDGQESRLENE